MNTLASDLRKAGARYANSPERLAMAIAVALAKNDMEASVSIRDFVAFAGVDDGIAECQEILGPDGNPVEGPVLMLAAASCADDDDAEGYGETDREPADVEDRMFAFSSADLAAMDCVDLGFDGRYDAELLPRSWRLGKASSFTLTQPRSHRSLGRRK